MKHVICSIYDKAIEAYMRPFVAQTTGQATRMFEDTVQQQDSPMGAHPQDYSLFHIANFNDNNADIENIEPLCLRRAHEINITVPQPINQAN